MSAKAKLEGLTSAWYGFAVFSAILYVVRSGLGFFTLVFAMTGLFFSWIVMFVLGRALVRKSSLTRALLLLVSGLFVVLGSIGVAKSTWAFVTQWELTALLTAAYTAVNTWMYARSFKVLTDSSVKAYFNS